MSELADVSALAGKLRWGIDQPSGAWPTAPRLKSYEAAGFSLVQLRMPPAAVLSDPDLARTHAAALGNVLDLTGLGAVLHAPHELMAGAAGADVALHGAVDYAAAVGAQIIVLHARHLPGAAGPGAGPGRLLRERRTLTALGRHAAGEGVALALENLAPVYPGPEGPGHDPLGLVELVRAVDSPALGICLDVGHANIVAGLRGRDPLELIEPMLADTLLFHLHDNFGAGSARERTGALEPLRLDLHLLPGAGTVPWHRLAPLLLSHGAPLQLEVRAPVRPEPGTLAVVVSELLGLGASARA